MSFDLEMKKLSDNQIEKENFEFDGNKKVESLTSKESDFSAGTMDVKQANGKAASSNSGNIATEKDSREDSIMNSGAFMNQNALQEHLAKLSPQDQQLFMTYAMEAVLKEQNIEKANSDSTPAPPPESSNNSGVNNDEVTQDNLMDEDALADMDDEAIQKMLQDALAEQGLDISELFDGSGINMDDPQLLNMLQEMDPNVLQQLGYTQNIQSVEMPNVQVDQELPTSVEQQQQPANPAPVVVDPKEQALYAMYLAHYQREAQLRAAVLAAAAANAVSSNGTDLNNPSAEQIAAASAYLLQQVPAVQTPEQQMYTQMGLQNAALMQQMGLDPSMAFNYSAAMGGMFPMNMQLQMQLAAAAGTGQVDPNLLSQLSGASNFLDANGNISSMHGNENFQPDSSVPVATPATTTKKPRAPRKPPAPKVVREKPPKGPQICPTCNKEFKSRKTLTLHQRSHDAIKPYPCLEPGCNSSFAQKSHLVAHRLTHTGERPFKCSQCSNCYTTAARRNEHMLSHTRETKYKCDTCGVKFRNLTNFKNHVVIHLPKDQRPVRKWNCPFCDAVYAQRTSLIRHRNKNHPKEGGNKSQTGPPRPNQIAEMGEANGHEEGEPVIDDSKVKEEKVLLDQGEEVKEEVVVMEGNDLDMAVAIEAALEATQDQ